MKILLCNKFHYARGGDCMYVQHMGQSDRRAGGIQARVAAEAAEARFRERHRRRAVCQGGHRGHSQDTVHEDEADRVFYERLLSRADNPPCTTRIIFTSMTTR